jgi:hypothetical protein
VTLGLEEGFELGLADGFELGLEEGLALGLEEGLALGLAEGFELGFEEGCCVKGHMNEQLDGSLAVTDCMLGIAVPFEREGVPDTVPCYCGWKTNREHTTWLKYARDRLCET